jgi:hypothetical protein
VSKAYKRIPEDGKQSKYEIKRFKKGDRVRIKLNKGSLDKSSSVSWSSDTFTVKGVIPSNLTMAEKYLVRFGDSKKEKMKEKYQYTRHDLQLIDSVDNIPDRYVSKLPVGTVTRQKQQKLEMSRGQFTEDKEKAQKRNLRLRQRDAKLPPQPVKVNSVMLKKPPRRKGAKAPVASTEKTYIAEGIEGQRTHAKKKQVLIKWKGYSSAENTWELEKDIKGDMGIENFKELLGKYKDSRK